MVEIGFLVFPNLMQLDLTGPHEVFSLLPNARLHLVWKTLETVTASGGLVLTPTTTYAECPQLDVICVPGGAGINALLTDTETLMFLRKQAVDARYITAVCTGSLVLGAAGLLNGKRAATHWMSMEFLSAFDAISVDERVVVDGNIITGGGVTAGIDFGLQVAAQIAGDETAKAIQLGIEYDPRPPFSSGHPRTADPLLVEKARARAAERQAERKKQVEKAVSALKERRSRFP